MTADDAQHPLPLEQISPARRRNRRRLTRETGAVTDPTSLPLVDEHVVTVLADADDAWRAVVGYATALGNAGHPVLSRVLGTRPRSGFEIEDTDAPYVLALTGRHRFSTYRLVFRVTPVPGGVRLQADTFARFPGVRGRVYRSLLMGTHGHQLATRGMLRRIGARAVREGSNRKSLRP